MTAATVPGEAPPLHVVFTMDCYPASHRGAPEGPKGWEQSARSIDGFCTRLLNAGYSATLFLTPACASMQAPLLEDIAESGIELGLLVQPQSLEGRYKRHLGQYGQEEQETIVEQAMRGYQDALSARPQSCRPAMFSASDDTFGVLYRLGFQQGSVSSPGRRVAKHAAVWTGAARDAHYVDPTNKLLQGDLPFLELPVTTDADHVRGGIAADLTIENSPFEKWHRPLLDGQVHRMRAEHVPFAALCIGTRNCFAYQQCDDRHRKTLDGILDYLDMLNERYDVQPVTVAGAHACFRQRSRG